MNILQSSSVLLYQSDTGDIRLDVRLQNNTVWLTQVQMAELFNTTKQNISLHLKNILEEGELSKNGTVKEYLTVQTEGQRQVQRQLEHYNLELIIAVGYRVRSKQGTQFRQWATAILKEYLTKGFALNDDRLKDPRSWDYFDELLERIRDIRASEKRFYQKVRDIYATSIDYEADSESAHLFFKTVQNKMLFAVTGKTAAELIVARADRGQANMGLTSWKGSRVRKQDVLVAKNYLLAEELSELNRIVTMFLDFADDQARRRQAMHMQDWEDRLDAFLSFNERDLLTHAGSISHNEAEELALQNYQEFDFSRSEAERIAAEAEAIRELEQVESDLLESQSVDSDH